jgi:tetratricopeptide (TPR) repeat protein
MQESSERDSQSSRPTDASSPRYNPLRMISVGMAIAGLFGLVVWASTNRQNVPIAERHENDPSGPEQNRPLELPVELQPVRYTNPGYVGAKVCGECHQTRLEEFRETRHFLACCSPTGAHVPSGFGQETSELAAPHWPFRFRPIHEDNNYIEEVVGNTPDQSIHERYRIDLIYGSKGKADEVYFTWRGNQLFELPFAWLHPQNCWAKQIYGDVGDNVLRPTTPRCLECHTTYFEHVPGTSNEYHRESIIPGVTCESCHGPGREHVEHHRQHPALKRGFAVVHPGKLSRERQMDLCGQCHSPALHHRTSLLSYRPGDDLETHFRSLTNEGIENDHVANQTKYLKRSKCYQKSESLTCHTCHDPHRPTDSKRVGDACAKCHQPEACRAQNSLPADVRNQCVDCHMPNYNRVAVKFKTADADDYVFPMRPREHQIGIYPRANQEVLLNWHKLGTTHEHLEKAVQLTKDLVDSWTKEGDRLRTADRLLAAIGAYREALRFEPDSPAKNKSPAKIKLAEVVQLNSELIAGRMATQRLINQRRTAEAIESLEKLLKRSPSQAAVHGRLGTMYELQGEHTKALKQWAAVNQYDPDDAYGYNMRGWTAYVGGRFQEAIEAFRRADELLPMTAEINFRWGLACLGAKDPTTGAEHLRVALRVNPGHWGAMQAMSWALCDMGKPLEAVPFAAEACRRSDYTNFDVLISWVDACLAAHRNAEAREAINRAEPLVKSASQRKQFDDRIHRLPD